MTKVANSYPTHDNAKQQPVRNLRQVALYTGCLEATSGSVVDIALLNSTGTLCVTAI